MKIAKQTPTTMVIKADGRTGLLGVGVTFLVVGLLLNVLVRVEPLTYLDVAAPDLIKASQERDPADSPNFSLLFFKVQNTGRMFIQTQYGHIFR